MTAGSCNFLSRIREAWYSGPVLAGISRPFYSRIDLVLIPFDIYSFCSQVVETWVPSRTS